MKTVFRITEWEAEDKNRGGRGRPWLALVLRIAVLGPIVTSLDGTRCNRTSTHFSFGKHVKEP